MNEIKKFVLTHKILIIPISIIHFIISIFASKGYFVPLREGVGTEIFAMYMLETGANLNEDKLSQNLLKGYSYVLAFLLIVFIWSIVFYVLENYKRNKKFFNILFLLLIVGYVFILFLYPQGFSTADFQIIYNYSKLWIPMYWHTFITSMVYMGIFLVFPTEIFVNFFQYTLAISVFWFFFYKYLELFVDKNKQLKFSIIFTLILFTMPEIYTILFCFYRNDIYPIFTFLYINCLMLDYITKQKLTYKKLWLLSILVVFLMVWRCEGILYLPIHIVLLFVIYKPDIKLLTKNILRNLLIIFSLVALFKVLSYPDNYCKAKYHKNEYAMTNTFRPLCNVFNDKSANLTYEGAEEDIKNIDNVYPYEQIKKYGDGVLITYNWGAGRWSHLPNKPVELTDKYMKSFFNIVFHNPIIVFKGQVDNFLKTMRIFPIFNSYNGEHIDYMEFLNSIEPEKKEKIYSYFWGYSDLSTPQLEKSAIWNGNKIMTFIHKAVTKLFKVFSAGARWVNAFTKLFVFIVFVYSLVIIYKRKYFELFMLLGSQCGLIFAIAMTSPATIYDYFNHPFICLYSIILVTILLDKKEKIKAIKN